MQTVYGCDFSGAKDASKGLFYAEGLLDGHVLRVQRVQQCDDRLDLYAAIIHSEGAWGMDFPFSLPQAAFEALGAGSWEELLAWTAGQTRADFLARLQEAFPQSHEVKCSLEQLHPQCRAADGAANSYSPLKQYNPGLRSMVYSAFKLLHYLRKQGVTVYPFDQKPGRIRLYEVYPSQVWSRFGLKRAASLQELAHHIQAEGTLQIEIPGDFADLPQDGKDAVTACMVMAHMLAVEEDWTVKPDWCGELEWERRLQEGLILPYV
ncbi:hypothetical protein [Ectobacillus ponti]|uniref:DUF429 domain-containing protein n=1 Tax=Ectobacillus ponti TaxID=2961894 RepID=A0AA41X6F6_9BACI|nr:hypothetical protein [Ectobacillus ponti]MCP8968058.1 hypothetical protein [Ectobacillus ponti]